MLVKPAQCIPKSHTVTNVRCKTAAMVPVVDLKHNRVLTLHCLSYIRHIALACVDVTYSVLADVRCSMCLTLSDMYTADSNRCNHPTRRPHWRVLLKAVKQASCAHARKEQHAMHEGRVPADTNGPTHNDRW